METEVVQRYAVLPQIDVSSLQVNCSVLSSEFGAVYFHVVLAKVDVVLVGLRFHTLTAYERLFTRVNSQVGRQILFLTELLAACVALEILLAVVDISDVALHVLLRGERLGTVGDRTDPSIC